MMRLKSYSIGKGELYKSLLGIEKNISAFHSEFFKTACQEVVEEGDTSIVSVDLICNIFFAMSNRVPVSTKMINNCVATIAVLFFFDKLFESINTLKLS